METQCDHLHERILSRTKEFRSVSGINLWFILFISSLSLKTDHSMKIVYNSKYIKIWDSWFSDYNLVPLLQLQITQGNTIWFKLNPLFYFIWQKIHTLLISSHNYKHAELSTEYMGLSCEEGPQRQRNGKPWVLEVTYGGICMWAYSVQNLNTPSQVTRDTELFFLKDQIRSKNMIRKETNQERSDKTKHYSFLQTETDKFLFCYKLQSGTRITR